MKLSKEQLEKRLAASKEAAKQEISKREVLQIRLDGESIVKLHELAASQRKPVSAMVREWILQHMEPAQPRSIQDLVNQMSELSNRLAHLEAWKCKQKSRTKVL